MKTFAYGQSSQGGLNVTFALPFSDSVMVRSLAANTAESITVPSGAKFVKMVATTDFYANVATTATIPGDVTDGSASTLNPGLRVCDDVTTISVISPATCVVTAEFYAK